jgi:predicted phosphodiesterase
MFLNMLGHIQKVGFRNKKFLAITFALILVGGVVVFSNFELAQAPSKNAIAKKDVTESIGDAVEGNWSSIEMVNISKHFVNGTVTVYNKTLGPTGPQECEDNEHLENGICVPDTPPPGETCDNGVDDNGNGSIDENCPPIPPDRNVTRVILVGDIKGNSITSATNERKPDLFVALGDLGYQSDLSWFKDRFKNLGNRVKCIIGNHDAPENEGPEIYKEAIKLCGHSWSIKIGNDTILMLGFNTNGDLNNQLDMAQRVLSNTTFMEGVKSILVLTHKPCFTHPGSHHEVEDAPKVKTFCNSLATKFPQGVKILYISGHNHEIASTSDGLKFVSGGGGQSSHRECEEDPEPNSEWNYCRTQSGFLEYRIDKTDGSTEWKFLDSNGEVIH